MNTKLLERLLSVQSETYDTDRMRDAVERELDRIGAHHWRDAGNIYAVKGEAEYYPCVVAHTDTVHEIIPDEDYRVCTDRARGQYFGWDAAAGEATGIGGDDKVGIFLALSALEGLHACKAAFFRDEEAGCIGSEEADLAFFDDCSFILQGDRKGSADFVTNAFDTALSSDAFQEAVRPLLDRHGYGMCEGGLTDVVQLTGSGVGISAANISCGYYDPHLPTEYIVVADVERALALVLDVARTMGGEQWPHMVAPRRPRTSYWSDEDWLEARKPKVFDSQGCCVHCGKDDAMDWDSTREEWFCWGCAASQEGGDDGWDSVPQDGWDSVPQDGWDSVPQDSWNWRDGGWDWREEFSGGANATRQG